MHRLAFRTPAVRDGAMVRWRDGEVEARVEVVSPAIVRVRIGRPDADRETSHVIVRQELPPPHARVTRRGDRMVWTAASLRVTVRTDPWDVLVEDRDGHELHADDPLRGTSQVGEGWLAAFRLRDGEHVFGFGERAGALDKRGRRVGGTSLVGWNTNASTRYAASDPFYACVPFWIVVRDGRAHGILLDNTHRAHFDVGRTAPDVLAVSIDRGALDLWILDGPRPADVLRRFAELTGRPPLPPRWSLGYHQCRYSYPTARRVREIARQLRQRRIPADAIWLDIHHQEAFRPLTWDPKAFPDPDGLIAALHEDGFRVVTIVDAHPPRLAGNPLHDSGVEGGHFVALPNGELATGDVWPARSAHGAATSVFPDFARSETRAWWGEHIAARAARGVDGIWCDMNEPAVFDTPNHTLPLDAVHHDDGRVTDHREMHNLYGMLHARATFEGLARQRPGRRPFVLTRASFAGGQRFGAIWTGDVRSDWASLGQTVATLLGMSLSGMPFCGADVGGFVGAPTGELFARWLQAAVLTPFVRAHTDLDTPPQEPWSYGKGWETVNRRTIELRYALLPQIERAMREAHETGLPPMRPLFVEFPDEPELYGIEDQFLLGGELLVAPVLRQSATERRVRLPRGDWFDWWSGARHAGGRAIRVPVTRDSLPLYARAGSIVLSQSTVQHTGEPPAARIVTCFPGRSQRLLDVEDDGESTDGVTAVRSFTLRRLRGGGFVVAVSALRGGHRPLPRDLVVRVPSPTAPRRVLIDGSTIRRGRGRFGWAVDGGFAIVRLNDDFRPHRVELRIDAG